MNPDENKNTLPGVKVHNNGKCVNSLTSLASFPENIRIAGLNPDERVILFVREYIVVLFFDLFFYSLVLLLPFFIQIVVLITNSWLFNNSYSVESFFVSKYWIAIVLAWFSFVLRGFLNIFFKWFYNINILTNNRFIDIDFISIFKNRVEETSLMDIEDAKDTQSGIIQSIFEMGNIEILTASGVTVFSLENVRKASKVRDFVMDVVVAERKAQGDKND